MLIDILDTDVLIEVDGDYWYGNENIFETLSVFQKQVRENDIIKEKILKLWEELK